MFLSYRHEYNKFSFEISEHKLLETLIQILDLNIQQTLKEIVPDTFAYIMIQLSYELTNYDEQRCKAQLQNFHWDNCQMAWNTSLVVPLQCHSQAMQKH
jgi:hypothetical protein